MSLLMDALRKAEQEKKAAAEKLREKQQSITDTDTGSSGLSLSLSDDDRHSSAQQDEDGDTPNSEHASEISEDPDTTLAEPASNLELDSINYHPVASEGTKENKEQTEESADGKGESAESEELSLVNSESDTTSGHGDKFTIDMSGEASEETLGSSGDNVDEDTLVIERQNDQSSSRDSATLSDTLEQSRTYSGGSTREATRGYSSSYTPVSAQNVFAARKSSSYATITVAALVLLVVIGLGAYGVFYYFSVTPISRNMPSPAVARGVEATEALPIVSATDIDTGISAQDIEPPAVPEDAVTASQTTNEAGNAPAETTTEDSLADTPVAEAVLPETERAEPVKPSSETVQESASTGLSVKKEIELKPALLEISRSKEPAQESQVLVDAYQAFRRGELETATSLYRSVYDKDRENLDALLGLAAIAVREERYGQAYGYYSAVLRLNPANPSARAALINLQQQADPATSESRIKQLLGQYPDSAYLHYALANVYSRQQRWPDAQQEYFNAYSNDSGNPDYAFNLAVTLDHMNKNDAALDYYKRALKLSEDRIASFDMGVLQQRITALAK